MNASEEEIIMELKLGIPVEELARKVEALIKIYGEGTLSMRQAGKMLQIYKPAETS